ncbi:MAG: transposase [Dehalococcoidia bacterium]|nr:transposase [Dehalococcoidia bacterium]
MNAIAPIAGRAQVDSVPTNSDIKPSAYGGVLLLVKAWAVLGGDRLATGIHWQGRGRGLLLLVLVALPVLSPRSILAVSACCAGIVDPLWQALGWAAIVTQRRLTRFVSGSSHDWLRVLGTMVAALNHHPATRAGKDWIIAVDGTTIEKCYGPKLAGIRPVYDVVKKRLVDGYELVSGCIVGADMALPLGLLPHRKAESAEERKVRRRRKAEPGELPSKLDLALELVKMAVAAGVSASTVVADSGFTAMWWLREIVAMRLQWLVSVRQDRRLRIGAEIRSISDWCSQLSLGLVEVGNRGTSIWGSLLPEATLLDKGCNLKGLACRPAYFERRNRQGRVIHRWYLVSSQLTWDLGMIWQTWKRRWAIEVLHRECKQHLSLADFHVRHWEGIVTLIACTSLRASLLYFIRAMEPCCRNLSIEALVIFLREAACLVELPIIGRVQVSLPPKLQAETLWQDPTIPLSRQQWPIDLKAA